MSDEEYKGNGHWVGAIGRGTVENFVGSVGGAAIGAAAGAVFHNPQLGARIGGAIGGIGGAVHGGVKGWHDSTEGEKQFDSQKSYIQQLEQERAILAAAAANPNKGKS